MMDRINTCKKKINQINVNMQFSNNFKTSKLRTFRLNMHTYLHTNNSISATVAIHSLNILKRIMQIQ